MARNLAAAARSLYPRVVRKRTTKLARLAVDRAISRLANGLLLVVDGAATPVGNTPRDLVLRKGKLEVHRYRAPAREEIEMGTETVVVDERAFRVPILIVPPLMVRPYIYDLRPEHSMVRLLRRFGFQVFLVDFGVPDRHDTGVRLDDYVLDWLPAAVEAVRVSAGSRELSLLGYCMGSIFSLLYTAAWRDAGVRNIVSIAAPTDFTKMGLLTTLARVGHEQAMNLTDRIGNVPGFVSSQALKLMAPIKRFTRYADLFINLWNDEYVKGFDAMHRFTNDFIPYPQAAFKQFLQEVVVENGLKDGLRFGDRVADLREVRSNLLVYAGREDTIAPPRAVRPILELVGSTEKDYREVPGGHIGVIAGGKAADAVWKTAAEWLRPRSL